MIYIRDRLTDVVVEGGTLVKVNFQNRIQTSELYEWLQDESRRVYIGNNLTRIEIENLDENGVANYKLFRRRSVFYLTSKADALLLKLTIPAPLGFMWVTNDRSGKGLHDLKWTIL